MAEIPKSAIDSLVTKIEGLDLSSDEISVLGAVLNAAEAASEVEGFGFTSTKPLSFGLPDLRGRVNGVVMTQPQLFKGEDPRTVVINHEEQY